MRTAFYALEEDQRWLTDARIKALVERIAKNYPEPDTRARAREVLAEARR